MLFNEILDDRFQLFALQISTLTLLHHNHRNILQPLFVKIDMADLLGAIIVSILEVLSPLLPNLSTNTVFKWSN